MNSCILKTFAFLVPVDPDCPEEKTNVVSIPTSRNITLDLTELGNAGKQLCVKIQPPTNDMTCKPVVNSTICFDNLNASTQYKFSVFSYQNTSGTPVFSSNSCQISEYTCKICLMYFLLPTRHSLKTRCFFFYFSKEIVSIDIHSLAC